MMGQRKKWLILLWEVIDSHSFQMDGEAIGLDQWLFQEFANPFLI